MGIVFTRLFSSVFGNREARILVLGLDNAGKTTILYRLQMGEVMSTIPSGYGRPRTMWGSEHGEINDFRFGGLLRVLGLI